MLQAYGRGYSICYHAAVGVTTSPYYGTAEVTIPPTMVQQWLQHPLIWYSWGYNTHYYGTTGVTTSSSMVQQGFQHPLLFYSRVTYNIFYHTILHIDKWLTSNKCKAWVNNQYQRGSIKVITNMYVEYQVL